MINSERPGINPDPVASVSERSCAPEEVPSELVNSEPQRGFPFADSATKVKSFPEFSSPAEVSVDSTEKKGPLLLQEEQEEETQTLPAFLIDSAIKFVLKPNGNSFEEFMRT